MAMTVEARLNVAVDPRIPVFPPSGVVFYRDGTNNLRKAVMDAATDVQFTNALTLGGGVPASPMALMVGNFYIPSNSCSGGVGAPVLQFVNMITAAVTTVGLIDPGPGQSNYGTIGVIGNKVCLENTGGGTSMQMWSLLPPLHGLVNDNSTALTAGAIYKQRPLTGASGLLALGSSPAVVRSDTFLAVPPAATNSDLSIFSLPILSGIYNPVTYVPQDATRPWLTFQYGSYWYIFGQGSVAGVLYPLVVRNHVTTGVADVQILDAATASINMAAEMNAWVDQTFGRIYWAFGGFGFRLHGASLDTWPLVEDSVDVDTGNNGTNSIRGLATEPPYIYLTKSTGPTYGHQFIRVYDTALDARRRPKKRGAELWDLIPEVAPYISP